MRYKLIIFDLDGTLVDTSEGIYNSVRYAEKMMNLIPIPKHKLDEFIGPPPIEMYKKMYSLSDNDALKATDYHREYGRKYGIYESEIYPYINETLNLLKENDVKLAVATLKRQDIAERVLRLQKIFYYFDFILGMDEQESFTKKEIINKIMAFSCLKNTRDILMVGDSVYDMEGASEVDVDFVGVRYGFGLKYEIYNEVNKKIKYFNTPEDLYNFFVEIM